MMTALGKEPVLKHQTKIKSNTNLTTFYLHCNPIFQTIFNFRACLRLPCLTDLDCPKQLTCQKDRISSYCSSEKCFRDKDCTKTQVCRQNKCVTPAKCVTDDQCNVGYLCQKGGCKMLSCRLDKDCPKRSKCDTKRKKCRGKGYLVKTYRPK